MFVALYKIKSLFCIKHHACCVLYLDNYDSTNEITVGIRNELTHDVATLNGTRIRYYGGHFEHML